MGIYVISPDEIEDEFEEFLMNQEGDVPADAIAEVWNRIAKKQKWHDRLFACDKRTHKQILEAFSQQSVSEVNEVGGGK